MKLKNSYFFTLREDVKDEDSVSGNLLVRSGMIKRVSTGVYMFLPLGYRVLKKIEKIIREEMNSEGAQEVTMPTLIAEDIYEASGRLKAFGSSVFKLNDRYNKKYILGPTHEELFTMAGSYKVKSYKDLPFNLYQFQTKFRDEVRPRYGLIRVREFVMKDAYSFDVDLDGLENSYRKMYNAYIKSFDRMDINYKIVTADTGVMGGLLSEEFQAVTDIGEDILVLCDKCDYASNIEVSKCVDKYAENNNSLEELKEIYTPNVGKIKDLVDNYNIAVKDMTKSMIYKIDEEFILIMVRSDYDINEVKLQKLFNATNVVLAESEDVKRLTGAEVGFAGPIGINLKIVADYSIKAMRNFLVGANKTDYHYINANIDRDFEVDIYADIRNTVAGDICPKCGGTIHFKKGIEIGNTFKLGTKYSEALGLNYLDKDNKSIPVVMGSYGIGLGRCMAAIVEQNNDDKGIIWPINVAPYQVAMVLINNNDSKQVEASEDLYNELNKLGIDTILDNRDERPGVKFNDMDLIGIPIRIVVGNKINENMVEIKMRNNTETETININEVIDYIKGILK